MWRACGKATTNLVRKRATAAAAVSSFNKAVGRCPGERRRPFPRAQLPQQLSVRYINSMTGGGGYGGNGSSNKEKGEKNHQKSRHAPNNNTSNTRNYIRPQSNQQVTQANKTLAKNNGASSPNLVETVQDLLQRSSTLAPLPPIWSLPKITSLPLPHQTDNNNHQARRQLFRETRQVLQAIRDSVKQGTFRPKDKHPHQVMTVILEKVLLLYSRSLAPSTPNESVFAECQTVLDMVKEYQLDLQHNHVEYAILIAAREQHWQQAADLFWSHIDPEDSGYVPRFAMTLANPVGLYAIARHTQETGGAVVENVMDGVMRMSMVAPTEQRNYILEAGTALGHADEWQAFINYLKTSYISNQLGQPLVAAVMHTCLLCNRPDEALEVFDEFVDLDAGEWQWAGGQDRLDPLCRDLAMQALGGSTGSGVSARALKLFQETQEDAVTVSAAALNGVVCACEKDGNWEDTVALLFSTLNKPDAFRSIVSSDELDITDVESPRQTSPTMYRELGLLLNSVMRTCNTNKQFGVALLCLRLFELSLPSSVPAYYQEHLDNGLDPMERSLVPVLCETGNTEDCLASTIISLCGVSCPSEATAVFNTVKSIEGGQDMFHASAVNDFALSKASHTKTNQLYEKWHAAWRHMHRITAAISILRATGERMAPEQAELLSSSLATALRCCTAALHPEAGLHLAQWVEGGTDRQNSTEGMLGVLPLTDTLVAAIMEAYNATDGHTVALDFFEAQAIAERPDSQWTLSYNAALDALFSLDRHQDGIALFRQALALHRNPDMFCITAKRLVASKKWEAMGDVYRLALTSGCLSEELCKFALVAISSGRQKGTMPRLRSIVEEAAKLTDTDSASWLISKYWSLKRILGFTTVRGLMWWDDPRTAHLDELEFAFATLEKRATTGFTPKNDALRLIATAARTFQEDSIPPNRTGLPHVPRTREGWIDTMARVLIEAKETTLLDSSNFITDVAVALRRLDCDVECVGVVSDALARGVWLDDRALEEASAAARNAGMEGRTVDDIQMLVTDTTSREQRQ